MRAMVLERDGHRCQWAGCTETSRTCELEVHHRIPIDDAPHLADDLSNQVTLCPPHHLEAARQYRAAH
jgi:5-methylcytosine-specific restriction endonuclease McrA